MPDDSMRTVVAALGAGLAVALANATPSMNNPSEPGGCTRPE